METKKQIIVCRKIVAIGEVDFVEQYSKWVVKLAFTSQGGWSKYWLSDKQKAGIDRCKDHDYKFGAFDISGPKERFVYASSNPKWLCETFKAVPEDQIQEVEEEEIF